MADAGERFSVSSWVNARTLAGLLIARLCKPLSVIDLPAVTGADDALAQPTRARLFALEVLLPAYAARGPATPP